MVGAPWYNILMLSLLAFAPIVAALVLLAVFKIPARKTLPLTFLLTVFLACAFWQMNPLELLAFSLIGGLQSIDILLIIFGALLLFNILAHSGGLNTISSSLKNVSADPRIQAIIIGFGLVSLLEALAGFGTPAAIAAPLLVALGFSPLAAVTFSLICNIPATAFGAVGTPTIAMMSIVGSGADTANLPLAIAILNGAIAIFTPLIATVVLVFVFGRRQSLRANLRAVLSAAPFALFAGISFAVPFVITAGLLGPEMPSIVASGVALVATAIAAKTGFLAPKTPWHFRPKQSWPEVWRAAADAPDPKHPNLDHRTKPISPARAWLPYVLISLTLIITRLPQFGVAPLLRSVALRLIDLFGVIGASYYFRPLWIPGTVFVAVAVLTLALHRVDRRRFGSALAKTCQQTAGAALTIGFGLALTQIMMHTDLNYLGNPSMISLVAGAFAALPSGVYVVISPLLGIIGSFVSGSNTVSNILFTRAQFETAGLLGLNPILILALQCAGGSIGNIICLPLVVAASPAADAHPCAESKIVTLGLTPMLAMTALALIAAAVVLTAH
jgi:lactate permease